MDINTVIHFDADGRTMNLFAIDQLAAVEAAKLIAQLPGQKISVSTLSGTQLFSADTTLQTAVLPAGGSKDAIPTRR